LFPSWYKANSKKTGSAQVIDKVSGKLATECTPERAKETVNNAAANQFSADKFVPGGLAGAKANGEKDDVHKCGDTPPSISLSPSGDGYTATVSQGIYPISSEKFKGVVNFIVDGQIIRSFEVTSNGQSVTLPASALTGSGTLTAQVIDSVLYEGTASIAFSSGSNEITLSGSGGNFTWNSISGGSPYKLCYSSSTVSLTCTGNITSLSYPIPSISGSNKKAYIQANNGTQSNSVSL